MPKFDIFDLADQKLTDVVSDLIEQQARENGMIIWIEVI